MSKNKIIIFLAFILILTSIRLVWISSNSVETDQPFIDGTLDLTDWDSEQEEILPLTGEWDFYPDRLLDQNDVNNNTFTNERDQQHFPKSWFKFADTSDYTYGTYHLELTIDQDMLSKSFSLYIPRIPSATRILFNGDVVRQTGNSSSDDNQFVSSTKPFVANFHTYSEKIDILIHVSHDGLPIKFPNTSPLLFGETGDIMKKMEHATLSKVIVLVLVSTFALFGIILFFMVKRPKVMLYFFLLMINVSFMVLLDVDTVVLLDHPFSYANDIKLRYINYILMAILLLKFCQYFLPKYAQNKTITFATYFFSLYLFLVIILPITTLLKWQFLLGLVLIVTSTTIIIQFTRALKDNVRDSIFLMLCIMAIVNNNVWAFMKHRFFVLVDFYPVDLLAALIIFAMFWLRRFMRYVYEIEEVSEQLYQANKSKDDFLANTSHELRSPLHSMIHIAQYVLDNKENQITEKDKKDMKLLVLIGNRMSLLINDLIDLTLIKEKTIRLDQKNVNVYPVVTAVIDMMQYTLNDKDINIVNKMKPSLPQVQADENRLVQILLNLVQNAVKFTDKGTVTIQARVSESNMQIEIIDTGIGIEENKLSSIFQPYEQHVKQGNTGMGLGLVITKVLVELHGGNIEVDSEVNKGSVFRFTLPLAKVQEENKQQIIQPLQDSEEQIDVEDFLSDEDKSHLLLVDDESLNLSVISKVLDKSRYHISFAKSGQEALDKINRFKFDLIISDVMMPKMSGYELTKQIRAKYNLSELPVLLLTARGRPEDLQAGFHAGANDYIFKPIAPLELKARVRMLTDLKKAVTDQMRMEAAWLRAQIKPHFLFNSINSILILMEKDQDRMRDLLDKFIYYLQTSFDFQNAEHEVTLEQELELVEAYLEIEKARFEDRIQVNWHIDENIQSIIKVPPLSIQTLVENAVKHGILKRADGGQVSIEVCNQEDVYEIRIHDDGKGMPGEVKEMITSQTYRKKFGIGLFNTDKRLRQSYGKGLQIISGPDQGTTVVFHIPMGSN
ncbi:response regulator [Gracilibacillus salitolerans]|uniref:histidine kinase n=1 Tax=Gracilibacillus salitolerans TaxID=2663022 RepID=A0A5Q2TR94_9BACI|nr:ATP-binding protein [Gracilibacillus salitolerans]QGH35338.1 response regulator [Gracilibacillus salitolerans]